MLKGVLSFSMPNIDNNDGFTFVEDRDADETDEEYAQKQAFLSVPMAKLVGGGLGDGVLADITDFSQDLSITLTITHRPRADFDELKHPQFFELVGASAAAATAAQLDAEKAELTQAAHNGGAAQAGPASTAANGVNADAGVAAGEPRATGRKRKLEAMPPPSVSSDGKMTISLVDDDDVPTTKRTRVEDNDNTAVSVSAARSSSGGAGTGASLADAIEID